MQICPDCGSERVRRGGNRVWMIYLLLVALAVPAVLIAHLHAGIVAGVLLASIAVAHLFFDDRVCLECGKQWSSKPS